MAYLALTGELAGRDPRPVSELAPDAPGALDAVLRKALAPEKEQRYPTVSELVQAFTEAVPAAPVKVPDSMFEDHGTVMVDEPKLGAVPRPPTGPVAPVRPTGPMPVVALPPEPRPSMETGPERPVHLTGPMPMVTPPEPRPSMKTGPERPLHLTGPMPAVTPPPEPRPARDSAIQPRRTAVAPPTGDDLPQVTTPQDRPDHASSVFDAVKIKSDEKDSDEETEEATDFISVAQIVEPADTRDADDDEPEEPTLQVITVREFQEADTTESSFEAAATAETAPEDFKATVAISGEDTEDFKATVTIPPTDEPEADAAEAESAFDDAPTTMFDPTKLSDE